ncbi:hypothetical protein LEN26_008940 [Aphanomyces euteiches]|nr:hypothetical protein LEN26_008940 [Aphanomyces euteiches]KAH9184114.1 hypothetical protein AeNC1_013911 [Aphanomyces euteiches]
MTQTEWTALTDRFGPLGVVDAIAQQLDALSKSKSAAKTPVERPAVLAVVHDNDDSDKDKDVGRSTEAWQLLMPDLAVHVERARGVNSNEWTAETCLESMNQGRELVKAFVADNRGMLCVRGGRPSPSSELLVKSLVDLETDAAMTLLASTTTGGEPAVAILCGAILEAATCALPIVVDGYVAGAAALCARRIAPKATLHALFIPLDEMEPQMSSIVKVFDDHVVAIRTHGLGGFQAMALLMQAAKLLAAVEVKQDQDDAPLPPTTSPAAAPILPADATPPPELRIFLTAVMFLTRLPAYMIIPDLDHRVSELVPSFCYFPIIGWGVGGFAAVVLWLTHALFGSVAVAVVLSTFASVWLTGCFHEDGVADTFDSFGGGWSKNDILRIMKDSRLGTYGCMGLLLMTALKFAILTRVVEISASAVGPALVAGHVLGRYSSLFILQFFVYVEDERDPKGPLYNGIGNNLHLLTPWRVAGSTLFTALSMTILLGHSIGLCVFAVGLLVSYVAGDYFAGFLGGVIGDCLGCANQVVEVVVYLTIAMVHQF